MRRPFLLAIAGDALLTLMDAVIKAVAPHYAALQIAFLRFAIGAIVASLVLAAIRPGWPSAETVRVNAGRSVLVVITASTFFYALGKLPLGEAIALAFLSPVYMAVFAAVLLRETLTRPIVLALGAGFAGMLVIVGGRIGTTAYSEDAMLGVGAVLISGVTFALAMVLLRARASRDGPAVIVWFQNVGPALILAVPAVALWRPPSAQDLWLFAVIGLLGTAGHYLLALAFAGAEAVKLAPLHYLTLLWAIAFGYLLDGEVPALATIAGATLIVAGAWLAQRR